MAGKGGGAWKVAYADFVTAMMAFFLVMWITAQSKEVKQAVAQYFEDPPLPWAKSSEAKSALPFKGGGPLPGARFGGLRASGRGPAVPVAKSSNKKDPKAAPAEKPSLSVLHDGNRRAVAAVTQFVEDSAELTEASKAQLKLLVAALLGKRNKIEIRGHATRRPLPSGSPFQDAWHLCYARSLAVMKCLESQGIEPDRIRLSQAGPFEPITIREQPELQAQNARVEIYALTELVEELVGTGEERAKQFKSP